MRIRPVLLVVDMQSGFCAGGGTFHQFGFNTKPYREILKGSFWLGLHR